MGTKGTTSYRIGVQNALHYITIAVVEWLDIFTRRCYKDTIIESLAYCRKEKGLELYGYVIMTNHIHLICRAKEGFELSDILRDFKRHTAKHYYLKARTGRNPQTGEKMQIKAKKVVRFKASTNLSDKVSKPKGKEADGFVGF
jgi:REP element-mobilizing transposase RayT